MKMGVDTNISQMWKVIGACCVLASIQSCVNVVENLLLLTFITIRRRRRLMALLDELPKKTNYITLSFEIGWLDD
jgi:hypothetical protein